MRDGNFLIYRETHKPKRSLHKSELSTDEVYYEDLEGVLPGDEGEIKHPGTDFDSRDLFTQSRNTSGSNVRHGTNLSNRSDSHNSHHLLTETVDYTSSKSADMAQKYRLYIREIYPVPITFKIQIVDTNNKKIHKAIYNNKLYSKSIPVLADLNKLSNLVVSDSSKEGVVNKFWIQAGRKLGLSKYVEAQ